MPDRWTPEDAEFLKCNFDKIGGPACAAHLSRPLTGVYKKMDRIRRGPCSPKAGAWTDDELAILKSEYSEQGAQAIAERLGRTVIAVRHKAYKLGIECNTARARAVRTWLRKWYNSHEIVSLTTWKKAVKERDNSTCQVCGLQEPLIVTAHHIIPLHKGGGMFDVSNGITMCPNCHALSHCRGRGSGRRTSPETYSKIREMLSSGIPIEQIAKELGVNRKTVFAAS